ncbi:MAG: DUF4230 domain-containing protein [Lachnospiraceae bacterium]|jgi:hypothetical protein|nr:DUF4230 domain-containing protein [Lachnospiraceae bacterium]
MKKKIACGFFLALTLCAACAKEEEEPEVVIEPQTTQMRAICELATMDCYYHNVAKFKEEDAAGWFLWKKDKQFWVEYSGVVSVGIDASLVNIAVSKDRVAITMPPAKILDCRVDKDSLSEESFIVDGKSAKVTAEDQTEAFKMAQENMEQTAADDSALLTNAQQRAQKLLEDYVKNLGNAIEKQYTIDWVYVDEEGNKI